MLRSHGYQVKNKKTSAGKDGLVSSNRHHMASIGGAHNRGVSMGDDLEEPSVHKYSRGKPDPARKFVDLVTTQVLTR